MHTDYLSPCFRNLRDKLVQAASREELVDAADSAESALYEIEPARGYRCRDISCRLVPRACATTSDIAISGEAAEHDLRRLIEDLTEAASLRFDEAGQRVYTIDQLSKVFNVTTKTISRWREQGLVSRRFLSEGRKRIGFLHSSVERFVATNPHRIQRGQKFRQLSSADRKSIIQRARQLSAAQVKRGEALQQIAGKMGRSVETIRYTVKRYERAHPDNPIFHDGSRPLSEHAKNELHRQFRQGTSIATLSKRFGQTATVVGRVITQMRARRIMEIPLDCICNEEFDEAGVGKRILAPLPESQRSTETTRAPADSPAYIAALHEAPLLTREQEVHLFRKFNFLKYKAAKLRDQLDPNRPRKKLLDAIEELHAEALKTKNHILRANLRLVVAFARKRTNPSQDLFELISDGNVTLIRAVEKFDYGRGFKFSTYATWALIKNYGRAMGEERKYATRVYTGQDEVLAVRTDHRRDQQQEENDQRLRKRYVGRVLSRLSDRERQIIIRRFGLNYEDEPRTLKQVGAELGVSKERVRQLQARAFEKLREAARKEQIDLLG